jgi:hypothetical protein
MHPPNGVFLVLLGCCLSLRTSENSPSTKFVNRRVGRPPKASPPNRRRWLDSLSSALLTPLVALALARWVRHGPYALTLVLEAKLRVTALLALLRRGGNAPFHREGFRHRGASTTIS